MVETSYAVPNALPRYSWARYASARPLADPPVLNSSAGISSVVTKLVVTRKTLMITAAVVSSRRVPAIRPAGACSVSVSWPRTSGMTATPVSKPDRPSASFGNTTRATPIITSGSLYLPVSAADQSPTTVWWPTMWASATITTTALSRR